MKLLIYLIFWFLSLSASLLQAEIIPPGSIISWTPGNPSGVPRIYGPVANVKYFGARADGETDDFPAFQAAMKSLVNGGVIFVPAGEYYISSTLLFTKDNIVLRGEGAGKSKLLFGPNAIHSIEIVTYQRGAFVDVIAGFTKGSKTVTVSNVSEFKVGGFAEIQQENDAKVMYTNPKWNQKWAKNSVGQILVVEKVEGNNITFTTPLYLDYDSKLKPQIRPQGLVKFCGVEDLYLERKDGSSDGHMISIKNAAYVWVTGVESNHTKRSHIGTNTVYKGMFVNNYFHHSFDYGGGGHGYGVELGFHTTNCLVENNIFFHLRHAMMVHLGASGNVFGYNYSTGIRQGSGETNLNVGWLPPDISIHGHFPNNNLFEGNVVEQIGIGDTWGPAGPGMVYARNRVINGEKRSDGKSEEGAIRIEDNSRFQYLIGNEVLNGKMIVRYRNGLAPPDRSTLILHGNKVEGIIQWESGVSDHNIPKSYYLKCRPEFLGSKPWPVIGSDVWSGFTIPAMDRFSGKQKIAGEHSRKCID